MLTLRFELVAGRYHATPWNNHVNEGAVEWPPSPWRILRALIATYSLKARGQIEETTVRGLIERLAEELPVYHLPGATAGHTRAYMPLFKDKTTKIFDAFLVPEGPIEVTWESVALAGEENEALEVLAAAMGYLGRAESWVTATLTDAPAAPNVWPAGVAPDDAAADAEVTQLLAAVAPADHEEWRRALLDERLTHALAEKKQKQLDKGKDPTRAKLSPKERAKIEEQIPASLFEALQADTGELRKTGWSRPPGSRWARYLRPRDAIAASRPIRARPPARQPTVARFALAGPVLPRLTDALVVAERLHTKLAASSDYAPVFSGKDARGEPLRGHCHAYILPESHGQHGQITHVTVYAEMGFDLRARRALDVLRDIWQRGGHSIQLVLLGVGNRDELAGSDSELGECPLLDKSAVWISRTPFVATRHPKRHSDGRPKLDPASSLQRGSPEHDLRRLLALSGLPAPEAVERTAATVLGGKRTRWLAFRTERKNGHGRRSPSAPAGFRITFPKPVRGPLALGYGAHFGLGVFVPDT